MERNIQVIMDDKTDATMQDISLVVFNDQIRSILSSAQILTLISRYNTKRKVNSYHPFHFDTRSEVFLGRYAIINLYLSGVLDKSSHPLRWVSLVRHLVVLISTVLSLPRSHILWYVIYDARNNEDTRNRVNCQTSEISKYVGRLDGIKFKLVKSSKFFN